MTDVKADRTDICETCGCPIPDAVFRARGPLGITLCRQTKCVECAFQAGFRDRQCKRRPYRVPGLRPKQDGSAPDVYVASFETERARRIQAGGES